MNKEDFRRNFSHSFLGVVPSALQAQLASVWDTLDLQGPSPLIPCTMPAFAGDTVQMHASIKLGDRYISTPVTMSWEEDLDENPNLMYSHHPAQLGMVQAGDTFIYVRRQPQRQVNRGYCPRYCLTWCPNPSSSMHSVESNSRPVIWHIFNPYRKTLSEALDLIDDGLKTGVVLDTWLGVFVEEGRRYPRIAYRNTVIGIIQNRVPVVYEGTSDVARDYILKVTGIFPKVK